MRLAPTRPLILKISPANGREMIERAACILESGGVVAVPTDTVYGLACHPGAARGLDRIFRMKGRDRAKPVPILAASVEAALSRGAALDKFELKAARAFWPGPLTLVAAVTGGGHEGLRVPDHKLLIALLLRVGGALRVTSANRSGMPAASCAGDVLSGLGDDPDAVLDAGPCKGGVPSTVARCSGGRIDVLRPGVLSRAELEEALHGAGDES